MSQSGAEREFARLDPSSGRWLDSLESVDLFGGRSTQFSGTWPTWGMTRRGVAFELPTPALPTDGSASSSSPALPTPTAMDSEASGGSSRADVTLTDAVVRTDLGSRENPRHLLPTPAAADGSGGRHNRPRPSGEGGTLPGTIVDRLLPTPTTADVTGGHKTRSGTRSDELLLPGVAAALAAEKPSSRTAVTSSTAPGASALLPTPTTQPTTGNGHARDLRSEAVTLLPTPAAHDSGNTPENHLRKKPGRSVVTSLQVLVDHDLIAAGGRIDPQSSGGSGLPDE